MGQQLTSNCNILKQRELQTFWTKCTQVLSVIPLTASPEGLPAEGQAAYSPVNAKERNVRSAGYRNRGVWATILCIQLVPYQDLQKYANVPGNQTWGKAPRQGVWHHRNAFLRQESRMTLQPHRQHRCLLNTWTSLGEESLWL